MFCLEMGSSINQKTCLVCFSNVTRFWFQILFLFWGLFDTASLKRKDFCSGDDLETNPT